MGNIETRVAILAIIVEDEISIDKLNKILFQYRQYIIGRMGLPYAKKNINVISIIVDAPQNTISALSGKVGKLKGITSKTTYSKV
jgi:putative iron-only hydrogenase system regulator